MKALCTETALFALRRRYPQIYETSKKLVLDLNEITVAAIDFKNAMKSITPASHRAVTSPSKSITEELKPLLQKYIDSGLKLLYKIFPPGQPVKGKQHIHSLRNSARHSAIAEVFANVNLAFAWFALALLKVCIWN